MALFPEMALKTGAEFSPCRKYRYALWRFWGESQAPRMVAIGLNPSTADEAVDDPTIRRLTKFAREDGAAGLVMLNLFALRNADPAWMRRQKDPIGPINDFEILRYTTNATCFGGKIVAAWGMYGTHLNRDNQVSLMLAAEGIELWCFGTTRAGHPRHPLYLPAHTLLVPWKGQPR